MGSSVIFNNLIEHFQKVAVTQTVSGRFNIIKMNKIKKIWRRLKKGAALTILREVFEPRFSYFMIRRSNSVDKPFALC